MAKVMLSVPTGEGLIWSMVDEALGNLDRGGHEVIQRNVSFYWIDESRNMMAQAALDEGCDYLFMVDSDTVVPRDALLNLMEHDVDVCIGYYVRGNSDDGRTSVIEIGHPNYRVSYYDGEIAEMRDAGDVLVKVKGGGMGCALVKTRVFRELAKPWFKYDRLANARTIGEDYYFCQRCHQHGIPVYMDTRVACDHLKLQVKKTMKEGE